MPIPIRPNNTNAQPSQPESGSGMSVDLLTRLLNGVSASIPKEAEVADNDADLIFNLWEKSSIIRDAGNIEDRIYKVPSNVSTNEILRLKSRGLLYGEKDQVRFTSHAAKIIKMMVLAEGNSFSKKSVKKPYSVILAEIKSPKRKTNLAVAEKLAE